jgi:hypothetical protein
MSLPMAAGGPLNVLMKPILTVFSWAAAGPAANASTVAAAMPVLIIAFLPSGWRALRRGAFSLIFLSITESPDFALGQSC